MERSRRLWMEVGVWLAFQVFLTSIPGDSLPDEITPSDWLAHSGVYAMLGALVARAGHVLGWRWRRLAAAYLVIVAFGALDELHQQLIPGREAALEDWIADAVGAFTGMLGGYLIMRTRLARWLA